MKPLLILILFWYYPFFVIAADECPKFVTNTKGYSGERMYVCNITTPDYWTYRDQLCDQECIGDCPNGECCTDDTSKKISLDPDYFIMLPSIVNDGLFTCKNKCKGRERCWELSISAGKGKIKCPCNCFGVPNGKRNQANSNQNPSHSSNDTCGDLVKLGEFTAEPQNDGILLNWTTKSELNSQGFRIWRAIPDLSRYCGCSGNIDDYTQIQVLDKEGKPVLIPAKGTTTSGFDYSYLDEKAKPGIAYCYALEDVDSKGESKFYFEYVAFTPDGLSEETKHK